MFPLGLRKEPHLGSSQFHNRADSNDYESHYVLHHGLCDAGCRFEAIDIDPGDSICESEICAII
jgi:hypothetical protein